MVQYRGGNLLDCCGKHSEQCIHHALSISTWVAYLAVLQVKVKMAGLIMLYDLQEAFNASSKPQEYLC